VGEESRGGDHRGFHSHFGFVNLDMVASRNG
jgi:hypothetical protein